MALLIAIHGATALAASLPASPASALAQAEFDRGVAAFQAEDYEVALQSFLAARGAGMDTVTLHYNLGSTYYRLDRHDDARAEFRRLLDDPGAAPTAHYNLGLIAKAIGDAADARRHFRIALDTADGESLRHLARRALETVGAAGPAPRDVLFSLAGGYDDNVTLAPQTDLLGVSEVDDAFLEVFAAARHAIPGGAVGPLRLDAAIYLREYLEVDRFDQAALRIGAERPGRVGQWRTAFGGHVDTVFLGGERFQNVYNLSADGAVGPSDGDELRVRYRLSRIDAIDEFDRLSGWRQRAGGELRLRRTRGNLHLGYEFEWNDRNDLRGGGDFTSLSPRRQTIHAEAVVPLGARLELTVRGEYRYSHYRDPDVIAGAVSRRRDRQPALGLRIDRRFPGAGRLFIAANLTDNDSTVPAFRYVRHEYQAGGEWTF